MYLRLKESLVQQHALLLDGADVSTDENRERKLVAARHLQPNHSVMCLYPEAIISGNTAFQCPVVREIMSAVRKSRQTNQVIRHDEDSISLALYLLHEFSKADSVVIPWFALHQNQ